MHTKPLKIIQNNCHQVLAAKVYGMSPFNSQKRCPRQPCRQIVGTPWLPCRWREQIELIWVNRAYIVVIDKLLYPAQHQEGSKYELLRIVPSFLDLFWYSFQRLTADFQSWNYSKNSPSRYSANTCRCLAENMLALHQCYGLLRPHHFFQDSLPCLMLGPKFLLQSRFGRDQAAPRTCRPTSHYDGKGMTRPGTIAASPRKKSCMPAPNYKQWTIR